MNNDTKGKNPQDLYYTDEFPYQKQNAPGIQEDMKPVPDCGEDSYKGTGRLQGRKALITGGDSGIGRAVAIAYAREGAQVAINYLPSEQEDADSLTEVLKKEGVELILVPGDIREESECIKIVEDAARQLDGLDILVLNAARQVANKSILDITEEQLRTTFEVNVYPMFYFTKAALKHMKDGSSIILTGSAVYFSPAEELLDYSASKSAVVTFGKCLSKQLIKEGIRVNVICPGPVWTPLEISGGLSDENIPVHGQDTLFQRSAQPVEMSGLYVYLASDDASYATAEVYGLTGGADA